jgi:hypothetical protein
LVGTGVVDEDIETAELPADLAKEAFDLRRPG